RFLQTFHNSDPDDAHSFFPRTQSPRQNFTMDRHYSRFLVTLVVLDLSQPNLGVGQGKQRSSLSRAKKPSNLWGLGTIHTAPVILNRVTDEETVRRAKHILEDHVYSVSRALDF